MRLRQYRSIALRLAAGAYPLLIFAACRNGTNTHGAGGTALLYCALALPLVIAALAIARSLAGGRPQVQWAVFAIGIVVFAAAVWWLAPQLQSHYQWFFLLQDLAFFGLFALYFGSSLRTGREPLCTYFARLVLPDLSPRVRRYTRSVTVAWTAFFVLLGAVSTLLFALASSTTWALFTNVLTPALIVLVFAIEYGCRWIFLAPRDRVAFLTTFAAIRKGGYRGAAGVDPVPPAGLG